MKTSCGFDGAGGPRAGLLGRGEEEQVSSEIFHLKYAHIADIDSDEGKEEKDDSRAVDRRRRHSHRLKMRARAGAAYAAIHAAPPAAAPAAPSLTDSQICVSSSSPAYLLPERTTSKGTES